MNSTPSPSPSIAEVRNWFGRHGKSLPDETCERLIEQIGLIKKKLAQAEKRKLAQAEKRKTAQAEEREAAQTAKGFLQAEPIVRGWFEDTLDEASAFGDKEKYVEVQLACVSLGPVLLMLAEILDRRRRLLDKKRRPQDWHMPALFLAGAFERELREARCHVGRGPDTVLTKAIQAALQAQFGKKVELQAIYQHLVRSRKGELTKQDLDAMAPRVAQSVRRALAEQKIELQHRRAKPPPLSSGRNGA
jgi:hypothetical protein